MSIIPKDLKQYIENELEAEEKIFWSEMPIKCFFTPKATGLFLFGIPWTAFALFWTAGAAFGTSQAEESGPFILFPLFGLPFILIGFGMLSVECKKF